MSDQEDKEVARGKEADFLLNHPLFKGAFADIEARIIEEIRNCPIRDREGLHELSLLLKTLTRIQTAFVSHIETGRMAEESLRREKALRERIPFMS